MRISLRSKIAISFALVVLVSGLVTTLTGIHLIGSRIIKEAQDKVRLDLNSAHEIYSERLGYIETVLRFTAIRDRLKERLIREDRDALGQILEKVRRESGLEFIYITDAGGKVVLRTRNPKLFGDGQESNPSIEYVLKNRKPVSSTEVIKTDEIKKEGNKLAERAHIKFIPTPMARPTDRTELTSGMALVAAVPMTDDAGNLIGVLYGGDLLNQNYMLVDKIKNTVYREEKYKGKDIGTATIFQGDVRISTNVMTEEGKRAIGTRVASVVGDQVLDKGKKWIDKAFVVNDWYITAYEPIRDLIGNIVGILYVGILERPFKDAERQVVIVFVGIALLGVVIVMALSNFIAGRISKPLREMQKTAQLIASGDYTKDIKVESKDVVGELADAFNKMTKKLLGVQEELQNWARRLEDKVEERTREIKDMNEQLIQAEKMVSVGKLAAGVAHEINNPLTGILTNASLLMEGFPEESTQYEDLKMIVDETIRCRQIVKGLLDFARQTRPEKELMDINELLEAIVALVQNQVSFQNIKIGEHLDESIPNVMVDKDQLRQVFMNIVLNASDAMPHGGSLNIRSGLSIDKKCVEISFTDTGKGINPEDISKLFDPFFSTKEHGTGLGLSISLGIVEQHGGTMEVRSEKGKGATFIVRIPVATA